MVIKCNWIRLYLYGLFFSCTNLISVSAIPFILSIFLIPKTLLVVFRPSYFSKITFYTFLFYVNILFTLIIYNPESLLYLDFYRYNGNFLIVLLPFLILPALDYREQNCNHFLYNFMLISIVSNLIAVLYQFYNSYTDITGLFVSTNGFGGFMITPFLISYFFYINKRNFKYKIFLCLTFLLLASSYSRGSIIFAILSILCYHSFIRKIKLFSALIYSVIIIQIYLLSKSYPVYIDNIDSTMFYISNNSDTIKQGNILLRIYENWPRAIFHFFSSPLIGTGFGSINDQSGISGFSFFGISSASQVIYNSAHAHHQFLNILGEQGVIGFFLFILILHSLYKYILIHFDSSIISSVLITSFYALVLVSFTENRLSSPSNVFPFILIFMIFYINNLNDKTT